MTRLAFLADIHANLPALEAVLEDMKQFHFDQVIVVGDSISVGTFSVEVLAIIQQHHWAVIREIMSSICSIMKRRTRPKIGASTRYPVGSMRISRRHG